MKKILYSIFILGLIHACNQSQEAPITKNTKGEEEITKNELSVEDVQKIEAASKNKPWMTYDAILGNGSVKSYQIKFDSGASYLCSLASDNNLAKLDIYHQLKDKQTKTSAFVPFAMANNTVTPKATGEYKINVSLKGSLPKDSIINFLLEIYKDKKVK